MIITSAKIDTNTMAKRGNAYFYLPLDDTTVAHNC